MRTQELDYNLPAELIAQHPLAVRSRSRLLVLERAGEKLIDSRFYRIGEFLRSGDCLVLNNARVVAARFFAARATGGKVEGLFTGQIKPGLWEVMLRGLGKLKPGERIWIKDRGGDDYCAARMVERTEGGRCLLELQAEAEYELILEAVGFVPLPPYIKREARRSDSELDRSRYQTVYAEKGGAVAAPTAGLHFTRVLLDELQARGIVTARVTLDVGPGTFRPIGTEFVEEHRMHGERWSIDEENARIIAKSRESSGRIVAVGTTSARCLESAARSREICSGCGRTELFITPGYKFRIVDAMITNFHLPRSSLLAMVSAFAGLDKIRSAYEHAIEQRYRFYSYGDAMLIV